MASQICDFQITKMGTTNNNKNTYFEFILNTVDIDRPLEQFLTSSHPQAT